MEAETAPAPMAAPPLNQRNILNILSYLTNVVVTYGVLVLGAGGVETNEYLSLKYQTLITPAGWAFSIWAVIFLAEAAFSVAQALPEYRSSTLVQQSVRDYFIGACAAQIMWTMSFTYEFIGMSLLAMLCLCFLLVQILKSQYEIDSAGETQKIYWLFRFPFEIHGGWVIAASFVNFSVWLVSLDVFAMGLVVVAIISLVGIIVVATGSLWYLAKPNFTVPTVLAWALIGVAEELKDPKQSIFNVFTVKTINGVRISAALLATIILVMVITRAVKEHMKETAGEAGSCGDIASGFVKVEDDKGFVKVDTDQV